MIFRYLLLLFIECIDLLVLSRFCNCIWWYTASVSSIVRGFSQSLKYRTSCNSCFVCNQPLSSHRKQFVTEKIKVFSLLVSVLQFYKEFSTSNMIIVKVKSVFCIGFDPVQWQYKVMLWQNSSGRLTVLIFTNIKWKCEHQQC